MAELAVPDGLFEEESYGLFPGGDPRLFTPDPECCTPAEIERHRLACAAWDAGEGVDDGPQCATVGDGTAWTGGGFGIGVYRFWVTAEDLAYMNGVEQSA